MSRSATRLHADLPAVTIHPIVATARWITVDLPFQAQLSSRAIGHRSYMNRSHTARSGAWKLYKGSRKRLRATKITEHSPARFWMYVVFVLTALAVLLRLLITAPPEF